MSAFLKINNIVYWLALSLWLAALASAGIAAMNVFPTTDAMPLTLDDWPMREGIEHNRLLAGHIMDGVFFAADAVQFVCVPLVVLTLVVQLWSQRRSWRRPANAIRAAAVLVAAAMFSYYALGIAPRMNSELRAFWAEAKAGDAAAALSHRQVFNELHPTADAILRVNLILVLIAIAASATACTPRVTRTGATQG